MEDDARAPLGRGLECERRDGERTLAVGRPAPRMRLARPARVDHDVVGDHEGGIEADAELADQRLGLLARVLGRQLVEKSLGAGAGDGAEARGQVLARHADSIVGDGQRLLVRVQRDGDDERPALNQFGPGDRLVAEFFAGVGGIGDEFADKDFPVGIDRMDHEMQQARNVGLEALRGRGFGRRGLGVGGQRGPLGNDDWGDGRARAAAGPDIVALPPGFKAYRARQSRFSMPKVAAMKNRLAEIHRPLKRGRPILGLTLARSSCPSCRNIKHEGLQCSRWR